MLPTLRARHDDLAFLPAALEIVERPPSPVGRAISGTIIAVFAIALIWACVGHVDIVASATGKIIPSGRSKIVQPFATGVVRAIHVRDGQHVTAGDVLVELDQTIDGAERDHLKGDLTATQLDVARLRAAMAQHEDPLKDFHPPANASPAMVAMQQQFLANQVNEHRAKLATLDRQKKQREAELTTIDSTIAKLQSTISIAEQRVDVRKELFDKQLGSKLTYLSELQDMVSQQKELDVQRNRRLESEAAVATITETKAQTIAEFRRALSGDLATAEQKAAALLQDVIKADERVRLQKLIAPVDGVVQQLAIHTVGGVVTPAQSLLVIVPSDSQLEIEAMVSNRDIGFVHPGQAAEIKVDTFNFTKYGLLHGKIISVSHDAITRDKPVDRSNSQAPGSESASSEPKGQELVYAARVSLDRTRMQIEENVVNLSPGMAVTTEIKTGTRTVLSYLLSPLLRYRQEILRER